MYLELTGHQGMPKVILSVLIVFDVFPFEGIAPTADEAVSLVAYSHFRLLFLPTTLLAHSSDKIHLYWQRCQDTIKGGQQTSSHFVVRQVELGPLSV